MNRRRALMNMIKGGTDGMKLIDSVVLTTAFSGNFNNLFTSFFEIPYDNFFFFIRVDNNTSTANNSLIYATGSYYEGSIRNTSGKRKDGFYSASYGISISSDATLSLYAIDITDLIS